MSQSLDVESLLGAMSPQAPCGEDPSYEPAFLELERRVMPAQLSMVASEDQAEATDWSAIRKGCLQLFEQGKHLRVAVFLALAELHQRGLPGLRDGLGLLAGLLERHWEAVHPQLDAADGNDPIERFNILSALVPRDEGYGDALGFCQALREAPLCRSTLPGLAVPVSLADIRRTREPQPVPAEDDEDADARRPRPAQALTGPQIETIFQQVPPEQLGETLDAVEQAQAAVEAVEQAWRHRVPSGPPLSLAPLSRVLSEVVGALGPYVASPDASTPVEADPLEAVATVAVATRPPARGVVVSESIQSRDEVILTLQKICDYYKVHEPASPVPLLLRRAQRLVKLDFLGIVRDLLPGAVDDAIALAGVNGSSDESME